MYSWELNPGEKCVAFVLIFAAAFGVWLSDNLPATVPTKETAGVSGLVGLVIGALVAAIAGLIDWHEQTFTVGLVRFWGLWSMFPIAAVCGALIGRLGHYFVEREFGAAAKDG